MEANAQVHHVPLGPNDQLLLCSHGLHDVVSDDQIAMNDHLFVKEVVRLPPGGASDTRVL